MSRPATFYPDATATPRLDRVTLAVVPIDPVGGGVVRAGVRAKVNGLPDRPLVSGSGMLVFINLPDQPQYEVEVDASGAGFFGPRTLTYQPPDPADPDQERRRRLEVLLEPRPDYPFPAGTTLVRGAVLRGAAPVEGASIECRPPGSLADFTARSGAAGSFALALRLPPSGDFDSRKPVPVRIRIGEGADLRELARSVVRGRSHSFLEPIDLAGANEPGFFTI